MDEGGGLEPDDIDGIFDQYRLDCGDAEQPAGDLRLLLCRAFVEAMGGTISAGNRTDRSGAVFTMAFPSADQRVLRL
jgi:two-component system sensor histidine kinase KdpD